MALVCSLFLSYFGAVANVFRYLLRRTLFSKILVSVRSFVNIKFSLCPVKSVLIRDLRAFFEGGGSGVLLSTTTTNMATVACIFRINSGLNSGGDQVFQFPKSPFFITGDIAVQINNLLRAFLIGVCHNDDSALAMRAA